MRRHVEVVLKALDILDCCQFQPVLTLKEIIDFTGMTRSRAMRLTGTLVSRGYLLYESKRKHFGLGSRVMTLGKVFEVHNTLVSISRPILRDLVRMTRELASLYVIDGLERVALAREKSSQEISYTVAEGQRMELYAGAAGKVLLAFSQDSLLVRLTTAAGLKRFTPKTLTDARKLRVELRRIKKAVTPSALASGCLRPRPFRTRFLMPTKKSSVFFLPAVPSIVSAMNRSPR